jgi:hypothetical protein
VNYKFFYLSAESEGKNLSEFTYEKLFAFAMDKHWEIFVQKT